MAIILIPQAPRGQDDDNFEDLDIYNSHDGGKNEPSNNPVKKKSVVYSRTEEKEFYDLFDRSDFSDAALDALEDRAYRIQARRQELAESIPHESAPAYYRSEMKKLGALPNGEKKAEAFWQLSREVNDYRRGVEEHSNPKTEVDNEPIEKLTAVFSIVGALASLVLSATMPFMIIGLPLFLGGGAVIDVLWSVHREVKEEKKWKAKLEQFKNNPLTREMNVVAHEINGQKLEAEKKAEEAASSQKNKSLAKKKDSPRKSAKAAFGTKKLDKKAPPVSVEKKPVDRLRL